MQPRPKAFTIMLILAVIFASLSPISAAAASDAGEIGISEMLPPFEGFQWRVFGIAGYGHAMEVQSIAIEDDHRVYRIDGEVDDLSDGEAEADFAFSITYTVEADTLVQETEGETLLESKFDRLELLRTPLVEGNTWQQVATGDAGEIALECTIESVDGMRGERVYTVLYEDSDGDYYERRELQERLGVIHFARLMRGDQEDYEASYRIHRPGTGLSADPTLTDVQPEDWYLQYLEPIQRIGVIEGYPDGSFRPDREVSVAEFIKMVLTTLGHHTSVGDQRWYDPYVTRAEDKGFVERGEFADHDRSIRREEMARILARAADELNQEPAQPAEFADWDEVGEEFEEYILRAVSLGFLHGYPDNTFRAQHPMVRAEAAKVLSVLLYAMEPEDLDREGAIMLEEEFETRLFPETVDGDWIFDRVRDFDRKDELTEHVSTVTSDEIASTYVDDYYEEREDGLYLIPKDGPILLNPDVAFHLELLSPLEIRLSQESWSGLAGDYEIRISYQYREGRWIMNERDILVEE